MWYKSRFYTEMHGVMEILQLELREHRWPREGVWTFWAL